MSSEITIRELRPEDVEAVVERRRGLGADL